MIICKVFLKVTFTDREEICLIKSVFCGNS